MSSTSDSPEVGDPVLLRGRIRSIVEGVADVEVYRTWPLGMSVRVPVQCGALEYDELAANADGGISEDQPGDLAPTSAT